MWLLQISIWKADSEKFDTWPMLFPSDGIPFIFLEICEYSTYVYNTWSILVYVASCYPFNSKCKEIKTKSILDNMRLFLVHCFQDKANLLNFGHSVISPLVPVHVYMHGVGLCEREHGPSLIIELSYLRVCGVRVYRLVSPQSFAFVLCCWHSGFVMVFHEIKSDSWIIDDLIYV